MDKQISKEQLARENKKRWFKAGVWGLAGAAAVCTAWLLLTPGIDGSKIRFATADRGTVESTVTASGRVSPLFETAVVSPVATKIVSIECSEGDKVNTGQPLLCLDLQSAETDMRRISDEVAMKQNEVKQTSLANATAITDLEMRIKAKEMAVLHKKAEVANERRLDSIGSGTGDRIREAQLAYETGMLELEQLRKQLANERRAKDAAMNSKELEAQIYARNLNEMQRTLEDARVKSPIEGTVTFLNKNLGTSIAPGEKLAVVSDLTHFKIMGEITEANSNKLGVGAPVVIKIGKGKTKGTVGSLSPQSKGGIVEFTVLLENDNDSILRSGLRSDLAVAYEVKDNVVRIPNGPYYQGPGNYRMFVKDGPGKLVRRSVTLGDSNFDFVEVVSGIEPGEEVAVSDMATYAEKQSLTLKNNK